MHNAIGRSRKRLGPRHHALAKINRERERNRERETEREPWRHYTLPHPVSPADTARSKKRHRSKECKNSKSPCAEQAIFLSFFLRRRMRARSARHRTHPQPTLPLVLSASLTFSLATCPSLSCSLSHSLNASPSYSSACSLCKLIRSGQTLPSLIRLGRVSS